MRKILIVMLTLIATTVFGQVGWKPLLIDTNTGYIYYDGGTISQQWTLVASPPLDSMRWATNDVFMGSNGVWYIKEIGLIPTNGVLHLGQQGSSIEFGPYASPHLGGGSPPPPPPPGLNPWIITWDENVYQGLDCSFQNSGAGTASWRWRWFAGTGKLIEMDSVAVSSKGNLIISNFHVTAKSDIYGGSTYVEWDLREARVYVRDTPGDTEPVNYGTLTSRDVYAEGWATNGSITLTNQSAYYTWTNWTPGEYTSDVVWTNNGIQLTNASAAGMYEVSGNLAVSQNFPGEHLEVALFKGANGTATQEIEKISGHTYMNTANEVYSIPAGGFYRLAHNDYLEIRFSNDSGNNRVVSAVDGIINFRIKRIGD